MKKNVLTNRSSSSTIIISMLCLISLLVASCDNMGTSMIPDPSVVVDPPPEPPVVVDPPPEPPVVVDPPPEPPVVVDPPPEPPVVVDPPPPEPPSILQVGDRVIVKQTAGLGIRIRDVPGGARIGGMFDGETGIVISGTREVRDLPWVEIEWDAPVKNPQSGCGIGKNVCVGWSAVVVENGTQVIHKQE